MSIQTNWYVVTGGPSSGITTTIYHLAFLGYHTLPEAARIHIDEERSKGRAVKEDIRADESAFQMQVLQMKVEAEARIPPDELIFLERGMEDSIAYLKLCRGDPNPVREACGKRVYRGVFLLDLLPFEKDYARTEDAAGAREIDRLLHDVYSEAGYSVTRVPKMSVSERAQFVLDNI